MLELLDRQQRVTGNQRPSCSPPFSTTCWSLALLWRKGLSMTRSQSIAVKAMFGLGLAFAPAAWADQKSDACAALVDARNTLYSMLNA